MRLLILTTFLLLTLRFLPSNAQSVAVADTIVYRVSYVLAYKADSLSPEIRRENMVLLVGKKGSVFHRASLVQKDSLFSLPTANRKTPEQVQNFINQLSALPKTRFYYRVYKNYALQQDEYIDEVKDKYYENSNNFSAFNWQLYRNDTATISGYFCQRATTFFAGRHYEAWFTRAVPISDGPYRFAGLPGLIVQLKDTREHYIFTLTNLRDTRQQLQPLKPFQKLTIPAATPAIYQGQQNEMRALAGSPLDTGTPTTELRISKERRDELLHTLATYNNKIELKPFDNKRKKHP